MDSSISDYFKTLKPVKKPFTNSSVNEHLNDQDFFLIDKLLEKNKVFITMYEYKSLLFFSDKELQEKFSLTLSLFNTKLQSFLKNHLGFLDLDIDENIKVVINKDKIVRSRIEFVTNNKDKFKSLGNLDYDLILSNLEDYSKNQISLKEMSFKLNIKYSNLYKAVTKILLYKNVKCSCISERSNSIRNSVECLFFIEQFIKFIDLGYTFIYIDESTFNNRKRTPYRWVSHNGKKIFFDHGRISSLNLIVSMTFSRIIHYEVSSYSCNIEEFQIFIHKMIDKIISYDQISNQYESFKTVLILDNVSFHRNKAAVNFYKTTKFNVLTLPTYNPTFNPVELIFSLLKSKFYKTSTTSM